MSAVIVTDLAVFKGSDISIGYNTQTLAEFTKFVELNEFSILNELFGNVFANDLLSNVGETKYTDLINDKVYTYSSYSYRKRALKRMLELIIFAKYTASIQLRVGASGMYELNQEVDSKANSALIINKISMVLKEAREIYREVQDYINRKWDTYASAPPEFTMFSLINHFF